MIKLIGIQKKAYEQIVSKSQSYSLGLLIAYQSRACSISMRGQVVNLDDRARELDIEGHWKYIHIFCSMILLLIARSCCIIRVYSAQSIRVTLIILILHTSPTTFPFNHVICKCCLTLGVAVVWDVASWSWGIMNGNFLPELARS